MADFPDMITKLPQIVPPAEGVRGWLSQAADHQIVFFELAGGMNIPPHHHAAQWGIIVEGQMEILLGDQVYEAKSGDFVHVSKGTVHRFINRSQTPTKMILTFVPAGDVEQFFREAFEQTTDLNAPPLPLDDAFIQRLMEAAARHDVEFLPPPEA